MTQLSEHFSLEELTVHPSSPQLDNTPDADSRTRLGKLANYLLERARTKLGVAIKVSSGYRSPDVNRFVKGSPTSSHMFGCAADTSPVGIPLVTAFQVLMDDAGLDYDQLIYEEKGDREGHTHWIHIGMAGSPYHQIARRQALVYGPKTNGLYLPFDPGLVSFT